MAADETNTILEITRLAFEGEGAIPVKEVAMWIVPEQGNVDPDDPRIRTLPIEIDPAYPQPRFLLSVVSSLVDTPEQDEAHDSDWWSLYDRPLREGVFLVSEDNWNNRSRDLEIESSKERTTQLRIGADKDKARKDALTKLGKKAGLTAAEITALVGC